MFVSGAFHKMDYFVVLVEKPGYYLTGLEKIVVDLIHPLVLHLNYHRLIATVVGAQMLLHLLDKCWRNHQNNTKHFRDNPHPLDLHSNSWMNVRHKPQLGEGCSRWDNFVEPCFGC